jgi:hypothetical protein
MHALHEAAYAVGLDRKPFLEALGGHRAAVSAIASSYMVSILPTICSVS